MADIRCEDRIDGELKSRVEDLSRIFAVMDGEQIDPEGEIEGYDDALDALDEYPLCVDLKTTMIVQISTGGPGDQFEIEIIKGDHGWELYETHATYRFLDWFDGATVRTDDPTIMRYMEVMVERLSW